MKGQLGLGDYENRFTPTVIASLLPRNSNSTSSKELLIKRQKSSNDLLNKSEPFNELMMKKTTEGLSLLQQDEIVVEIASGTLHTLIKTSFF